MANKKTKKKTRMELATSITFVLVTGHTREWVIKELSKIFKIERKNPLQLIYSKKNMSAYIYLKIVPCVLQSKSIADIPECRSVENKYICRSIPELELKVESVVGSYDEQAENYIKCVESNNSSIK